jgi:hypothetical protein
MKKDLIRDNNGSLDSAKIAFWVVLSACLVKIFIKESPDYSGLSLFISPFAALYFGRSYTKSKEDVKK